jgi:hypothetical protein
VCSRLDVRVDALNPRRVEHRRRSFAAPADGYRDQQPSRIGVDIEHVGSIIGEVVHLERDQGGLWAVCESHVDALLDVDRPVYFSVEIDAARDGTDIVLEALTLTEHPATVGQLPVAFIPGELRTAARAQTIPSSVHTRLTRALDTQRARRVGDPHEIVELRHAADAPTGATVSNIAARRSTCQLCR